MTIPSPTADDPRDRILSAAVALFAEKGFAAASLRELAGACGITKPALYHYFDNKDALFDAALRRATAGLSSPLDALRAASAPAAARLRRFAELVLGQAHEDPSWVRLVVRAHIAAQDACAAGDPSFLTLQAAVLDDLIAAGVAEGTLRADLPPLDLRASFLGALHLRALAILRDGAYDADEPGRLTDLFLRGAAAPRP